MISDVGDDYCQASDLAASMNRNLVDSGLLQSEGKPKSGWC